MICPQCGNEELEVTCMGYIGAHDPNKAMCTKCGWSGPVAQRRICKGPCQLETAAENLLPDGWCLACKHKAADDKLRAFVAAHPEKPGHLFGKPVVMVDSLPADGELMPVSADGGTLANYVAEQVQKEIDLPELMRAGDDQKSIHFTIDLIHPYCQTVTDPVTVSPRQQMVTCEECKKLMQAWEANQEKAMKSSTVTQLNRWPRDEIIDGKLPPWPVNFVEWEKLLIRIEKSLAAIERHEMRCELSAKMLWMFWVMEHGGDTTLSWESVQTKEHWRELVDKVVDNLGIKG